MQIVYRRHFSLFLHRSLKNCSIITDISNTHKPLSVGMTQPKKTEDRKLFFLKELSGGDSNIDLFEEIFYQFPDMIHSVDEEGNIIAFNAKVAETLGYESEELLGKSIFDIYAPELRDALRKGFKELKLLGQKDSIASKIITKSGELIDVEVRSLSLYDQQGNFVKTLSILRDMRELNTLRSSLIQQNKLAAIGELSSGIMHDIRNPLSIILSYSELLESELSQGNIADVQKANSRIAAAASRIGKLTNHLREFVRAKADDPSEFTISQLIDECLMMVESRIYKSGVTLDNQAAKCEDVIIGRPNRLEQVMMNLISNACDACASADTDEKVVQIRAEKVPSGIVVTVKDSGQGIKEGDIAHIFDAFFTTKPKGEGTGLGLSICKGIIDDQGGEISVTSTYGSGAEFKVLLPWDCRASTTKSTNEQ